MAKASTSKSQQVVKASTTSGQRTKANIVGKSKNAKSNKQDIATISKRAKKELLETQSSQSAKSTEEIFAAKIKQLTAENEALRKANAMKENVGPVVTRPEKGSAGNGFNLQAKMGLADNSELYGALRRCVRDAANKAGLDYRIKWPRQPKHIISQVIGVARERHEFFKRFPHGWAIEEFIKSSLKNKRAYARKRGYFEELGNANTGSNSYEESVNDNMYTDDEPEAGDGEFEGGMEGHEPEARNGEFDGEFEGEFEGDNNE